MISILYPGGGNWFFEQQARLIAEDLQVHGLPARAVSARQFRTLEPSEQAILVLSYAEIMKLASKDGTDNALHRVLDRFGRRILINYDCIFTAWFTDHFTMGAGYFSDIFDVCMIPQDAPEKIKGARYVWIPECFTAKEIERLPERDNSARPIPWAIVGHSTKQRASFISAAIQVLPSDGFVFNPTLRPFNDIYGLNQATLLRVLGKTEYYLWASHHRFPYHEAIRALMAITAGAVPVKIDPLYADLIKVPWVYSSLNNFVRAKDKEGPEHMYDAARRFILDRGSLGKHIKRALEPFN